ncbi:lysine--tRNA ligase [Halobaculum sp. MBLA0147]|uniref:lysine--tRNA ligase n=1 Tax=Halobaculum sp. MBLA0147 TaxID=3079934 RepID=UPI00352641E2
MSTDDADEEATPAPTPGAGTRADDDGDGEAYRVFWADELADEILARDPEEPIVIKGGVSPSGIPHLGHFNEILRGYFVAEVLRERGYEVEQVFTSDDRDALRKVPHNLATADWEIVGLGEVDAGALGRNLGVPYTDVPDPFGDCHDSYGDHFTGLLRDSAALLDVPVTFESNTELYESGRFDDAVDTVVGDAETAAAVLAEFQASASADDLPFVAQCPECGTLTDDVSDVDLDERTIGFACTGFDAGDEEIEGCGATGRVSLRAGKLPWRFEWPAQWSTLGVDCEPFGKDHAEGSWPSGERIAREVFDEEPPVPFVYEWFTLDGEALSSSSGHVVTVEEVAKLIEPAVVKYFFLRNPGRAKDFDVSRLDQLVDEFDRFERIYFGEEEAQPELEALAERAYPFLVDEVRPDRVRLPFTFAAVLGMVEDREFRVQLARDEGHFDADTPEWAIDAALERVERAREWAERCDNAYNYRLQTALPAHDFDAATEAALDDLADFVAEGHDGEAIQGEVYEAAKRHDVDVSAFFEAGYRLFFDDTQGPRLGEFLGELEREFVVERLRREA